VPQEKHGNSAKTVTGRIATSYITAIGIIKTEGIACRTNGNSLNFIQISSWHFHSCFPFIEDTHHLQYSPPWLWLHLLAVGGQRTQLNITRDYGEQSKLTQKCAQEGSIATYWCGWSRNYKLLEYLCNGSER